MATAAFRTTSATRNRSHSQLQYEKFEDAAEGIAPINEGSRVQLDERVKDEKAFKEIIGSSSSRNLHSPKSSESHLPTPASWGWEKPEPVRN